MARLLEVTLLGTVLHGVKSYEVPPFHELDVPFIIHNRARLDRLKNIQIEMEREAIKRAHLQYAVMHENPRVGCTLSHKAIIRIARAQGWPYVIIFEDDINFLPNGWYWFKSLIGSVPAGWDLYFGGTYSGIPIDCGVMNIRQISNFSCTHCYAVSAKFYDAILSAPDDVDIDRYMANLNPAAYVCWPMAAVQMPGFSDLKCEYVDYNYLLIKHKYRLLGINPPPDEKPKKK